MTRDQWFAFCTYASIIPGLGILLWELADHLNLIQEDTQEDQ